MREKRRNVKRGNKCVEEKQQQRCSANGGCSQLCSQSKRKCACYGPSFRLGSDGKLTRIIIYNQGNYTIR